MKVLYKIEITRTDTKTRTIRDMTITTERAGSMLRDDGVTKYELVEPFEEEYEVSSTVLKQEVDDLDLKKVIMAINGIGGGE